MPARSDPETIAFMQRVMGGIGVRTATELYDLLIDERLLRPSKARKVFRWVSGESAPNNKATVMLLERAGFLSWKPITHSTHQQQP